MATVGPSRKPDLTVDTEFNTVKMNLTLDQLSVVEFSLNALNERGVDPATGTEVSDLEQRLDSVNALVEEIRRQAKAGVDIPKFKSESLNSPRAGIDTEPVEINGSPIKLTTVGAAVHPGVSETIEEGREDKEEGEGDDLEEIPLENNNSLLLKPVQGRKLSVELKREFAKKLRDTELVLPEPGATPGNGGGVLRTKSYREGSNGVRTPSPQRSSQTDGAALLVRARAREAFMMLDRNGDGFLRKEDVYEAMAAFQFDDAFNAKKEAGDEKGALAVVEKMIEEIDIDGDGRIDLEEFISVLTNSQNKKGEGRSQMQNRMSMLAKNIVDAHQKKSTKAVIGSGSHLIHPSNEYHTYFDLLISGMIIVTVFTVPVCIGWDEASDYLSDFNLAIDLIFLLDVVKSFNTGFFDDNEDCIMDRRIIVENYLRGWFLIDVASSIPIEQLIGDGGGASGGSSGLTKANSSVKGLKLLKIAKVLRLFKLSKTFKWLKEFMLSLEQRFEFRLSDASIKLVKLAVGVLLAAHWIACFHWFLVRSHDFPEDSWVVYSNLVEVSFWMQYNWSLFKALAQMIMIGFETPPFTNVHCETTSEWCSIETWTTLLCLYIGTVFYALLVSNMSTIIMQLNQAKRHFEEKLQQVNEYMREKKLPSDLRERVRDYYHIQHSGGKIFDENAILGELAPSLRSEVLVFNSRELYDKVPVLKSSPSFFTSELASYIRPQISFADEDVISEGTTGDTMYFIFAGIAEVKPKIMIDKVFVALADGCYFGDGAVFLGVKRTATVRTRTLCEMYAVDGPDILRSMRDFPEIKEYMKMVAAKRKNRIDILDSNTKVKAMEDNTLDDEDSKTFLFSSSLGADAVAESHGLIHDRRHVRDQPVSSTGAVSATRQSLAAKTYARASSRSKNMKTGRGKHSILKSARESRFMGSMRLGFSPKGTEEKSIRRLSIGVIQPPGIEHSTSMIAQRAALGNKYKEP
ncbi:hypothetical protein TrVE_jg4805 [Triparma verrucosa]|uniref:Calmodulin n=1 Tax=Triparma verrucosa TaxID=1606542 RepID=A0A9W7BH32_9STRA|nr:hypothetical protein TrVE_jg4805 [Triparma verrucosa]